MSEKVQHFNPFIILIWVLQIIILAMDYSADKKVSWAIPVIGSFLLIQLYMVWKTNYDEMVEEQNQKVMEHYGTDQTPIITPGVSNLLAANTNKQSSSGAVVQLNISPSVREEDEEEK